MSEPEQIICADTDGVAERAARFIGDLSLSSIAERGRFTLVLAGGSTPKKAYHLLAARSIGPAVDWSKANLFFGDERFVPFDDQRSNFRMAHESLIGPAGISADRVFPMPTDRTTPERAARAYAQTLEQFFEVQPGEMPSFDLVLLGLGDDGHCASLFPHAAALAVRDSPVTWSPPGVLPPPVDRITLTFPAINAARHVLFLVSGANKADALRDVIAGRAAPTERPAAGVCPKSGRLTWLVDREAGRLIDAR